jgi:positive regulator of sigma E activity
MDSSSCIEQRGVIEEISDGKASVIFSSIAACGNCSANGVCELFGTSSRRIVVPLGSDHFSAGDKVDIVMKRSMGRVATVFAYLFPFILLMISLLVGAYLGLGELTSGLSSLGVLFLYFIGLYFFRNRIKKAFTFIIQKTS